MKTIRALGLLLFCVPIAGLARAQEADSGIDLRATVTSQTLASNELTEKPRSGSPVVAGFHGVTYPTIKFNEHWFITGAIQLVTRPYFYSDLSTTGYGAKGSVLQSSLNYARISNNGSFLVRAGELPTAFGSFPLRYDEADNPLVDLPPQYGYYYAPVSILGVAGAQIDAARGRWDGRIQFANSSPANPRSLFGHDQYGNWAGGGGYTIRQGFRVGASAYRGPYLDRKYAFYFPGEENPSKLPAHAVGIDTNWAHAHTAAYAEIQRFVMPYTVIPPFRETAGYIEVKQVLTPRWFVAVRDGLTSDSARGRHYTLETSAGFRPNRFQVLKLDYEFGHYGSGNENDEHTVGFQWVTTLHKSIAHE